MENNKTTKIINGLLEKGKGLEKWDLISQKNQEELCRKIER